MEGGPANGESGRVAVFEILSVDERLRHLIDVAAPMSELEQTLRPVDFLPFARYSRFLLEEGIVAPERIEQIFPKIRAVVADEG